MTDTRTYIWPCFLYDDARAAIRFLVDVLGFTEAVVYGDGDRVDHAELRWPEGGGVMLGTVQRVVPQAPLLAESGSALADLPAGVGAAYVVTDDPDMIHERVVAAGGNIVHPLQDEDYGSRGFTCRDPEGVHWSFGTYSGT
ncbi:VOC family protein [Rhodococcoides yunnanense]|uniref:VOC family protein n=1 Tax=Rhodococcoides yunnanense TaxID=278209 RepID=UPI0022B12334|nr:VOC family protein [Rhodococcus yunnanensis]MCZ4276039.1 VOC family protein [Rhodococcus yunnanensis]